MQTKNDKKMELKESNNKTSNSFEPLYCGNVWHMHKEFAVPSNNIAKKIKSNDDHDDYNNYNYNYDNNNNKKCDN